MRVRVESLKGNEKGRYHGYIGLMLGKPVVEDESVRFAMQGDGWVAKMFARKGEYFFVDSPSQSGKF